ncbi:MAG: hypothetical protein JW883_01525 [Deltaproteobacteria bacterium]|nr:hypothetical protein [Deltaproteobacteria bacterium]
MKGLFAVVVAFLLVPFVVISAQAGFFDDKDFDGEFLGMPFTFSLSDSKCTNVKGPKELRPQKS